MNFSLRKETEEEIVEAIFLNKMFTRVPYDVLSFPMSIFSTYITKESVTIEDVCREFGLGVNKQIRDVGVLTTEKLKHISLWTKERNPKRLITEPVLIFSKNKKCTNPIVIMNINVVQEN